MFNPDGAISYFLPLGGFARARDYATARAGSHGDVAAACVGGLWALEHIRKNPPRQTFNDEQLRRAFAGEEI